MSNTVAWAPNPVQVDSQLQKYRAGTTGRGLKWVHVCSLTDAFFPSLPPRIMVISPAHVFAVDLLRKSRPTS